VACVSPGLTDTEMWDGMPSETKAAMLAGFGKGVPMGRAGTSADVGVWAKLSPFFCRLPTSLALCWT
jgi:NAD(P)-dependent dehydrogenase (short-subunit alcohol dehydrogenase family)